MNGEKTKTAKRSRNKYSKKMTSKEREKERKRE
jgi:hypothetical protein